MNNKDDLNPFDKAVETDAKTPGPGVADKIIIPIKNAINISKFIYFSLWANVQRNPCDGRARTLLCMGRDRSDRRVDAVDSQHETRTETKALFTHVVSTLHIVYRLVRRLLLFHARPGAPRAIETTQQIDRAYAHLASR
jgi:hypothetical protein